MGVALDQGLSSGPALQRPELQLGPQPQRLKTNRAHAGAKVPQHAARGEVQIGEQLNAHLPLRHQAWMVGVLQPEAVVDAEQGQGDRIGGRRCFGDKQHQVQGVEVLRQGGLGRQPLHSLSWMTELLRQPEPIGGLQAGGPQNRAHLRSAAPAGIGQHRQRRGPLRQRSGEGLRLAAMQAHPGDVLPWAAKTGEGQLQAGGGGVKAQPRRRELLQQQPADAEPKRVATGQHHRGLATGQGPPQGLHHQLGPVAGPQLGRGELKRDAPGLLLLPPPEVHGGQQTPRCHHQPGSAQPGLGSRRQRCRSTGIGADHLDAGFLDAGSPCH